MCTALCFVCAIFLDYFVGEQETISGSWVAPHMDDRFPHAVWASNWAILPFVFNNHNRYTALFPRPRGWAGARREPLEDFMVQGQINRGRHTDHPAGRHSIQINQCSPPAIPLFYRPDALPAAQPTVSKHWRQLPHSDYGEDARVLLNGVTCTASIPQQEVGN